MKVLKLPLLALFVVLFSCKKDIHQSSAADSDLASVNKKSNISLQGEGTPKPVLTPSQTPAPVAVGNSVTVSYTATDPNSNASINCGRVFIYEWDNSSSTWVEVAVASSPTASFTFTPSTADDCAYKFRAGFAPGGGDVNCQGSYAGVDYTTQSDFCVDVIQPCVQAFTIGSNVSATNLGNGQYEFTVTYTLTSPVDVSGVKFQGGATSGGHFDHAMTDLGNTVVVNANLQNTVLKWEGDLHACQPQTVWFKYKRDFSCPATDEEVTGGWSAKTMTAELGSLSPLTYSCQ